jgi:hypothetical protein
VKTIRILVIGCGLALAVGACTKVYTERDLQAQEARELRDLPEDGKEEAGITRRIEDDGGVSAEGMEEDAEAVDEEVTNTP